MHAGGCIIFIDKEVVQLMMSKFLPVSAIRDKELSEVDYKNRTIQLQGKSLLTLIIQFFTIKILCAWTCR